MKVEMVMRLVDGNREWKRDANLFLKKQNASDDFQLFKFIAPPDLAGSAVLTREHHDGEDDQWVYVPAYHTVRRIPAANRGDAYLGTDYFYEDVLDPRWADYALSEIGRETIGSYDCIKVLAVPTAEKLKQTSGYSKTIYWVEPKLKVIPKQEFWDRSGKLLKRLENSSLKKYGHHYFWDNSIMTNIQSRHRTITEVKRRQVDGELSDDLFTQKALKRG